MKAVLAGILLLGGGLSGSNIAAAATDGFKEKDPLKFVSNFYGVVLKPRKVGAKLEEFRPWLSDSLFGLLLKAEQAPQKPDEVPPLNFDPFTSSQEDLEFVRVELVRFAVVRVWVKVKEEKGSPTSFLVFLEKKERLAISDLQFGDSKEAWFLSKFLKESY